MHGEDVRQSHILQSTASAARALAPSPIPDPAADLAAKTFLWGMGCIRWLATNPDSVNALHERVAPMEMKTGLGKLGG